MAWNDKPTDGQVGALLREYDAYLLEELDRANTTGAYRKAQAIEDLENAGILSQTIKQLAEKVRRGVFSRLIERAEREYYISRLIMNECAKNGQKRGRDVW